jgi:hypothetical protein
MRHFIHKISRKDIFIIIFIIQWLILTIIGICLTISADGPAGIDVNLMLLYLVFHPIMLTFLEIMALTISTIYFRETKKKEWWNTTVWISHNDS